LAQAPRNNTVAGIHAGRAASTRPNR
jgi:hypothetical protein